MSGALIDFVIEGMDQLPAKLRLAAATVHRVEISLTPENARVLAAHVERALRSEDVLDGALDALDQSRAAQAEAETALVRARQHLRDVEVLGRMALVVGAGACVVAAVTVGLWL